MHARQGLGEVAVAFVGDDHRRPRLGDEKIGAGDAHIGVHEFLAQYGPRLGDEVLYGVQGAVRGQAAMNPGKVLRDLFFVEVDDRRDDVARRLFANLDDVFAEIGLHRLYPGSRQRGMEPDLLRHHGLRLGDEAGIGLAA